MDGIDLAMFFYTTLIHFSVQFKVVTLVKA